MLTSALLLGSGAVGSAQTVAESFMSGTAPGWVLGGSGFSPILTSGGLDPAGQGWLRLTDNGANRAAYAYHDTALTSANRTVFTSFDFTHYNGSGADGTTFFLFDGSATFAAGAYGGSMGYAQKTIAGGGELDHPGLAGGYMAVSLDDWGNFAAGTEGRIGGVGQTPNSISVRGPGSGYSGYDFVASTGDGTNPALTAQLDFPGSPTRPLQTGADYRHAEILLTPTNQLTVWLQAGAGSALTQVLQADLSGYLRPETIKFGFTAGTGGANEIHELRNLTVATLVANLWDNGSGTGGWSGAGNWAPDFTPASGADVLLNNTFVSTAQAIDVGAGRSLRSLQIDAPFSYTLNNGNLTFNSDGLPGFVGVAVSQTNGVATGGQTINSALTLDEAATIRNDTTSGLVLGGGINNQGHTLSFDGSGATTANGIISGSGALEKAQSGSLTLGAGNLYAGGTTLSGGSLVVSNNAALGSGAVTLAGGTLSSSAGNTIANALAVQGSSGLTQITGSGALTHTGGNHTLLLDGTTLTGPVTLAENNQARTLTLEVGMNHASISGAIANGTGSGADGLTKTGAGTLTLAGSNTYTGETIVAAGTIALSASDRLADTSALNLAGGTLDLGGNSERIGNLTFTNGSVDFGPAATTNALLFNNTYGTPSGVLTINNWDEANDILASQTALGAGVLGAVYFSGYGSGATQSGTGQTVGTYGGGWLALSPAAEVARIWSSHSDQRWSQNGNWTGNKPNADTEVAVFGTGTQLNPQLNSNNYAVRGIRFDPGAASYDVTNDGSSRTLKLGGNNTAVAFIQQKSANNQTIGISTLALQDHTVLDTIGAGQLAISSAFTGSSNLVKEGTGGDAILSGNSSGFAGNIFINAGTLRAASNNALGNTTGTTTVAGGATLAVGGAGNLTIGEALSLAGDGAGNQGALRNTANSNTLSGAVTLTGDTRLQSDAGTLTLTGGLTGANTTLTTTGAGNLTLSGVIATGTGGLRKEGTGTLTLGGGNANTFTGATAVNAGTLVLAKSSGNALAGDVTVGDGAGTDTLRLTSGNQISDTATVTLAGSGVFDLNNQVETIRGLASSAGAAQVQLGSGALTIDNLAAGAYAGSISGTGTLNKNGAGRLTLSGGSGAFAGTTNVNSGIVALQSGNALGTSAVAVAAGANLEIQGGITVANALTLAGAGTGAVDGAIENIAGTNTLSGAVTLAADTRVQSSAGTLNLTGNLGGSGRTLTVGGAGNTSITGIIATGGGGLVKEGAGTLRLGAAGGNTFAGATVISAGSIVADAAQVFNNSAPLTLSSGAVLDLNGFAQSIGSLNGGGTLALGGGGTGSLTLASGNGTFSGAFSGSGTIIIGPGATLTLGADFNAPNVNFTLAGGTLALNGRTSTFGNLNLTGNSILDFGNSTDSVLTVNDVTLQNAGLQLSVQNWVDVSDYFFAQNFTGAVPDVRGASPQNQIAFNGFSNNSTVWQSYDKQITPAPEPATYGFIFIGAAVGLLAWRRRRGAAGNGSPRQS